MLCASVTDSALANSGYLTLHEKRSRRCRWAYSQLEPFYSSARTPLPLLTHYGRRRLSPTRDPDRSTLETDDP